jgi:hypothetical protein
MNTFGVDYQPTVTVIALREDGGDDGREGAHVASVGDGVRSSIPNAISREGAWGSRADGNASAYAASIGSGAWVEEPGARLFWSGMYRRLCSYLGRMAPVRKNGYRVAIALQGANYRTEAHAVAALARAAGFDEVTAIPATHALLCRWLAAPLLEPKHEQAVIAIAVGEASTLVAGFQLEWDSRGLPSIGSASDPVSIEGVGQAAWNRRLLDLVRKRLNEEPPAGFERSLQDAATRYALRLSESGDDQPVEWREIFEERLYAPLLLTYADCAAWPEAFSLSQRLPEAVRGALRAIGSDAAELLLVGGVGSVWPFAERVARTLGPVWRSGAPGDDVAAGATWWGELCDDRSAMLLDSVPALEAAPAPHLPDVVPGESRLIAPWERGTADVD